MPDRQQIHASRVRRLLAVALIAGLPVLTITPPARAATYKMYTCNVPGIATPATTASPWTWTLDGRHTQPFDNCLAGGGFGIALPQGQQLMTRGTSASLVLRRPGSGPKSFIGISRYRTWLVANLAGAGAPAFVSDGGAFSPPGGANTDDEPWASPNLGIGNQAVYVQLYCSTGAPGDCSFTSTKPLIARGIEVDLFENVSPKGTIDAGTPLANRVTRGRETIAYTAADSESGVGRVEALLGPTVVGTEDFSKSASACPHRDFNACQETQSGTVPIDTTLVPDGTYSPALRITDAAGNQATVRGADLEVRNGGGPDPAKAERRASRLTARFLANGRRTYAIPFGRSVRVGGRLTDQLGTPISNAEIRVHQRERLPGAPLVETASVRTDPAGRYRYGVPRKATSRTLQFSYRPGGSIAASQSVTLRVRATARLSVSLRGTTVRYSGRLKTVRVPVSGKIVTMQGRTAGTAWQTFAIRRTNRSGSFAGRYRLRVRRPGVQLYFRAKIPAQRQYPYAAGTSAVVRRRVP